MAKALPKRRRTETTPPSGKAASYGIWIGVDFGTSGWRVAYTVPGVDGFIVLTFGTEQRQRGGPQLCYHHYSNVEFSDRGSKWLYLGPMPIRHPKRTSSGLKQSLYPERLCQPGTEGANFLALCEKYGAKNWDILLDGLGILLKQVTDHLAESNSGHKTWQKITFTVPVIFSTSNLGVAIQEKFLKCIEDAGFGHVAVETEARALAAFLGWMETRNGEPSRKVFIIDMGSGTLDGGPYWLKDGHAILLGRALGRGGGIDDVKKLLWDKCDELSQKNSSLQDAALLHLLGLPPLDDGSTDSFEYEEHSIPDATFQAMIERIFTPHFDLIREDMGKVDELDEVIISGVAPTANKRLRSMLERLFRECNKQRESKFKVRFLEPSVAEHAVCKGAAIPRSLDHMAEFKAWAFGILYRDDIDNAEPVLQLKPPNSTDFPGWISVRLLPGSTTLIIEPHVISPGAKITGYDENAELPLYSQDDAKPLGVLKFDLEGRVEKGGDVWIRFGLDTSSSSGVLILEIESDDRKVRKKIRFEMGMGLDGLALRSKSRQYDNYEEPDEKRTGINTETPRDKRRAGQQRARRHATLPARTGRVTRSRGRVADNSADQATGRGDCRQGQQDAAAEDSQDGSQAAMQLHQEAGRQRQIDGSRTSDPYEFEGSDQDRNSTVLGKRNGRAHSVSVDATKKMRIKSIVHAM